MTTTGTSAMDSADTTAHARARRRKSRSTHGSSSIYRRIGGFFPSFPTTPPLLLLLFLLPFCLSLHCAIPSAFLGPSHTCFVARHRSPCPTPPFHNFHVVTAATSLPTWRTHTRARGDATFLLDPPQRYQSSDWVENLQSLLDSRIAKRISGHLWFNTAWAGAVTALFEFMPQWHIDAYISPLPHQLMSSALGLLLVFRTNAAYDRFWEARKVWGSVTNNCRNLARTGRIALDRKYHARFSMLVIAFSVTLRAHLQRVVVSTELEALLPSWEADQVRMNSCPPALIAMKLTHLINEAVGKNEQRSDFYALYLEQLVGELINCLGMAERILLTPVPASYSRHTSRFLSLYTFTLPFVLVHELEYFTVPAIGAICWTLFSIEEIGHLIEEPFSATSKQLPLRRMTTTIARDVRSLLQTKDGMDFDTLLDEDLLSTEDRILAENAPQSTKVQSFVPSLAAPSIWGPGKGDETKEDMEGDEQGGEAKRRGLVGGRTFFGKKSNGPATAASAAATLQSTERMNI